MPYIEYIREYISVHIGFMICDGMRKYDRELIGMPFTRILYSAEPKNNFSLWCWWKESLTEMGKFLVESSKNKSWLSSHANLHKKIAEDAQIIAAKIKQLNLSDLSVEQLSLLYKDFRVKTEKFNALSMEIDALDLVLEDELRKAIAYLFAAKREQNEVYAIMTTPSELSAPKKEEFMFYKLALILKETKKYDEKLINKILSDFWWSELNWRAGNEKTVELVKHGVRNIIEETKDIPKHIKQLEDYPRETQELKKKYLKNKELALLNTIFEEYALLHELRKETQMKTTYSLYLLFREISKQSGIPVEHIELYSPDELSELLTKGKKFSVSMINNRLLASTLFINNSNSNNPIFEFKTSAEAIKLRTTEQSSYMENVRDFSGLPASFGKAVGKVKIALSASEAINKVEKGDVLVTGMTLPDFVPAMKKAAAIITNEGGATCHAAIISREFNIPCIVGTKIATKILKDGMLVEVNANHGVVKILNNNSNTNK